MTLKWLPPDSNGGSPITNYIVEMRVAGSAKWMCASQNVHIPDTSFVVKGLTEGLQYEYRIIAENKAGPSPPSQPSKSVVARDPISKNTFILIHSYKIDNLLYIKVVIIISMNYFMLYC